MLTYRAAYRRRMGSFIAEVVDFPEASAFGATLADARDALTCALRYAAERRLRRGEPLPMPDPACAANDAYLVEDVSVWPEGDDRVRVLMS